MVFIKKVFPGLVLFAMIGAGCATRSPIVSREPSSVPVSEKRQLPMTSTVLDATGRLVWSGTFAPKIGDNTFVFSLRDSQGRVLENEDLSLEQEKKIHAILVKSDLSGFQHLHPEANRGEWVLPINLKEAGSYRLYLDYTPAEGERTVLFVPFTVPGPTIGRALPKNEKTHIATSTVYTAHLVGLPTALVAATTTSLTFELRQGTELVQEIGPYLGALGHVVIVQPDKEKAYLHVHPVTNRQPQDGRVVFETAFPQPGTYVAYGQFNIAGALHVFPMTLVVPRVATGTAATPAMPIEHQY